MISHWLTDCSGSPSLNISVIHSMLSPRIVSMEMSEAVSDGSVTESRGDTFSLGNQVSGPQSYTIIFWSSPRFWKINTSSFIGIREFIYISE